MKKIFSFVLTFSSLLLLPVSSFAGNASSAKLKIYGAWLSANPDCSSPIEISNTPDGRIIDMLANPTIAERDVPVDTYKCLILKISDVIKFVPETTDGHCVAGVASTIDVCQGSHGGQSKNVITGSTITCTDGTSDDGDQVFVYISRNSFCADGSSVGCNDNAFNAFEPPTSASNTHNGIKLSNDIVIDGTTSGVFVFNLDGKIRDDSGDGICNMEPPAMSYR